MTGKNQETQSKDISHPYEFLRTTLHSCSSYYPGDHIARIEYYVQDKCRFVRFSKGAGAKKKFPSVEEKIH